MERPLSSKELQVSGDDAVKVAQALTGTSLRILQLLSKEKLDVSTIAKHLGLSEPHISDEISNLESLNLIKASYAPGKRGIRKICELQVEKITIIIK